MNTNNNYVEEKQIGVCDVHRLVNRDVRLRYVDYCSLCNAWMCDECWNNLPKRAYAMTLKIARGEK